LTFSSKLKKQMTCIDKFEFVFELSNYYSVPTKKVKLEKLLGVK